MRLLILVATILTTLALGAGTALAGAAHFIDGAFVVSRVGNTLTVSGKEAGLGDLAQVHVVLTATAACVNRGGNHPQAANKQSLTVQGDFPVQNGHADFTLSATAVFQPQCSPPMTVVFSDVRVTDTTNALTKTFAGTF